MRVGDMVRFKPEYLDVYDPADHSMVDRLGIVVSVASEGSGTRLGTAPLMLLFNVLVEGGTVSVFEYEVEVVA